MAARQSSSRDLSHRMFSGALGIGDRLLRVAPYGVVRAFELYLTLRNDPLLKVIDAHVSRGQVAVDIGAHRGWYSRRLAARVGPAGRVHAIEPNEEAVRVLKAVARRNPNITIHSLAVSSTSGVGHLRRPYLDARRTDAMGSLSNPVIDSVPHDSVDVPLATLDSVLDAEARPVNFIKCDVEGHEHEVLMGAEGTIRAYHPVIMVEIEQRHRPRPVAETFDWLLARGYEGYCITSRGTKVLAQFDVERDQLRYTRTELRPERPDPRYVSDFLFVPKGKGA